MTSKACCGAVSAGRKVEVVVVACLLLLCSIYTCQARALSAQSSDSCSKKLFWFMAITTSSNLEYWRYGELRGHSYGTAEILMQTSASCTAAPQTLSADLRGTTHNSQESKCVTKTPLMCTSVVLQPRWQSCLQGRTRLTSFQSLSLAVLKAQPALRLLRILSGFGNMVALSIITTSLSEQTYRYSCTRRSSISKTVFHTSA